MATILLRLALVVLVSVSPIVLSAQQRISLEGDNEHSTTLNLLALAPYPDPDAPELFRPSWGGGPGVIPAIRLAVELINERTDILANYTLALTERDSGCNELNMKGLVGAVQGISHGKGNVIGVIGPACSDVTKQLGPLIIPERAAMMQIGIATSPALTDRSKYPYSFSTVSSSRVYTLALKELVWVNHWSRIGVLYDGAHIYFQDAHRPLEEVFRDSDIVEFCSPIYHSYFPLKALKETHLRVFIVISSQGLANKLLCLVHHEGLTFPSYQWIFTDAIIDKTQGNVSFQYQGKEYFCSAHSMETALKGSILLNYKLTTNRPEAPTVSGLNYSEYEELYRRKVEEHERELNKTIPSNPYANAYHDAVWAMALALNASILPLSKNGTSLSDYRPGRKDMAGAFVQELTESVRFDGVSGWINFNESTGHTDTTVELVQVNGHTANTIGYFDFNKSQPLSVNGTFIPDTFEEKHVHIALATFVTFLAVTFLQLSVTVGLHILYIVYSQHKSIKASSPVLNHLMFCGLYIVVAMVTATLAVGYVCKGSSKVGDVLCNWVLWCNGIGRTLILATICVKTWRIYRIFVHSWKPGEYLHNRVLFVSIIAITSPMLLNCIIRSSVWPLQQSVNKGFKESDSTPYIEVTVGCEFRWYDSIVSQLYEGFLLLSALCISILARHAKYGFKSTRSTASLIYTLVLIRTFGISLYELALAQSWHADITYSVLCVENNSVLFACLAFGLLPPLFPLVKEKLRRL